MKEIWDDEDPQPHTKQLRALRPSVPGAPRLCSRWGAVVLGNHSAASLIHTPPTMRDGTPVNEVNTLLSTGLVKVARPVGCNNTL